jgi:hypothetical protein
MSHFLTNDRQTSPIRWMGESTQTILGGERRTRGLDRMVGGTEKSRGSC